MPRSEIQLYLQDENAADQLAAKLAPLLKPGMVIYLNGQLGAGKTTLVRLLLNHLNHQGKVTSPTYTLVNTYEFSNFRLHHFDLYRLSDPEELEFLGLSDYLTPDAILLIEWPEKGAGYLPAPTLCCTIDVPTEDPGRHVLLSTDDPLGKQVIDSLQ